MADKEINKNLVEKWDKAINKGDLEALVSLYTDDAIRMQQNQPVLKGKEAIRASFKAYIDKCNSENIEIIGENKTEDVVLSGEYAIVRGTYSSNDTPKSTGKPIHDEGKWVCIRKRQSDGSWKFIMDIWNSDLPAVIPNQ